MKIPFTSDQFFEVFELYNLAVFPFQVLIILLGFMAVVLLHSNYSGKSKLIGIYLGSLWIWMGLVYHGSFFSQINPAAFIFGGVFIVQGLFLLKDTFFTDGLVFSFNQQVKDYIGYFFILFGLLIYPLIGFLTGHTFTRTIVLGLPCPTTILTFGFLMLTVQKLPKYLLIIPSLWAIIGLGAAFNFNVYQDIVLIVSAIAADVFLVRRKIPAVATKLEEQLAENI